MICWFVDINKLHFHWNIEALKVNSAFFTLLFSKICNALLENLRVHYYFFILLIWFFLTWQPRLFWHILAVFHPLFVMAQAQVIFAVLDEEEASSHWPHSWKGWAHLWGNEPLYPLKLQPLFPSIQPITDPPDKRFMWNQLRPSWGENRQRGGNWTVGCVSIQAIKGLLCKATLTAPGIRLN